MWREPLSTAGQASRPGLMQEEPQPRFGRFVKRARVIIRYRATHPDALSPDRFRTPQKPKPRPPRQALHRRRLRQRCICARRAAANQSDAKRADRHQVVQPNSPAKANKRAGEAGKTLRNSHAMPNRRGCRSGACRPQSAAPHPGSLPLSATTHEKKMLLWPPLLKPLRQPWQSVPGPAGNRVKHTNRAPRHPQCAQRHGGGDARSHASCPILKQHRGNTRREVAVRAAVRAPASPAAFAAGGALARAARRFHHHAHRRRSAPAPRVETGCKPGGRQKLPPRTPHLALPSATQNPQPEAECDLESLTQSLCGCCTVCCANWRCRAAKGSTTMKVVHWLEAVIQPDAVQHLEAVQPKAGTGAFKK